MKPLVPRTFQQYRDEVNARLTFGPARAPLYMDLRVPAVRVAYEQQLGSTWREIPWVSLSSWNQWAQMPDGIKYTPAVHSSGPANHARHYYSDLPTDGKFRDARWLISAAAANGIMESTFASTQFVSKKKQAEVLAGFSRVIRVITGVKL